MTVRSCILLLVVSLIPSSLHAQVHTITGVVRDASSGEALAAANIRLDGTTRGTISNADGIYHLSLPTGPHALIVSFIGYAPDTIRFNLVSDQTVDVSLHPIAIRLSEVVVTDEDPAYRIMRKVIENKARWRDMLRTYRFEAFTRQVLRRDTSIASITESYTTGYWQQGDTLREVIRQKRQTENVPMAQNFAAVGGIVNFYDDEIRFSGFTFIGPTAPDAFEYYSFRLVGTREQNGIEYYTITMTPESKLTPLFSGTLNVAGDTYAVNGVEVVPNEAYRIPFVTGLSVTYAQQFALLDGAFWMPIDIRLKGSAEISLLGFSLPRIGFEQVSSIYEYAINVEVPDTMFHKPRRITAPEAGVFDSTFWAEREVLALTAEEQSAYESLDSTQTLQKQFEPSGPLAALGGVSEGLLQYLSFRFNRVEGFFLGAEAEIDSLTPRLAAGVSAGYAFAHKKPQFRGMIEWFPWDNRVVGVGLEGYQSIGHIPDAGFYEPFTISLSAVLSKVDQRDYFELRGGRMFVNARPGPLLSLRAAYINEVHSSVSQKTDFSLFNRSRRYRAQPSISDGVLRSVMFSARYGEEPIPLRLVSRSFIGISIERSSPAGLRSDFDFTQALLWSEFTFPTFLKRNLFPPSLVGWISAGWSSGAIPVQRVVFLEGSSLGYGPLGILKGVPLREFGGDAYLHVSLEHNFRSIPFLALDIPFLYENSIELIVHGSVARSWVRPSTVLPFGTSTRGWYSEAGIGISKIFGLLRTDLTYRFANPRGFHVTIATARIF